DFFTDFYEKNDFAGIQLAVDRLPPGCPQKFYERFGQPMGEVTIPRAGRLAFIPRDPASRSRVDKAAARNARLIVRLEEADQQITISLDGKVVDTWSDLPINMALEKTTRTAVGPGKHVLTMAYAYGNAKPPRGQPFAPTDPREMAVMFKSLTLRADPPRD